MTKLFILHGWTYSAGDTWKPLLSMLAERKIEHEFLRIPGLSDGTNPVWTIDDYVKWLEEKTAGHEKIALHGHSNGGRISLAFSAKHPGKVAHLILEDSAGIPPRGARKFKRDFFRTLSQAGRLFARSDKLRNFFYRSIRADDYRKATPEMRKTMANLVAFDARDIFHLIAAPTLIIWGAEDKTTPLSDGKIMHEMIRDSRMHIIQGARHSPHITHPQEVADLIEKELKA